MSQKITKKFGSVKCDAWHKVLHIFRYNCYLTLDIYIFRKSNIWTLTTRWRWEGHLGNNLSFMILCQCMSMFRLFGLNPILTSSFSPSCKKHPKKSRFGAGRSWASFCLTMTKCYEYELCFCVRVPIMARNCVAVWLSFVLQFWHWYSESDKYIQILLWMGALTTSEYECWENSLLMARMHWSGPKIWTKLCTDQSAPNPIWVSSVQCLDTSSQDYWHCIHHSINVKLKSPTKCDACDGNYPRYPRSRPPATSPPPLATGRQSASGHRHSGNLVKTLSSA